MPKEASIDAATATNGKSTAEDSTMWSATLHAGLAGTFLGLPYVQPNAEEIRKAGAKAAIYGMPWDATSISRTGASYGPRGIRNESCQFLTYNATLDFDVVNALSPVDCGDVDVVPANAEKTFANAQRDIGEILDGGAMPLVLGGDHSITIPGVRAVAERYENPGLILVDTHLDTAPDVGGELLNHCCEITRAVDAGFSGENIALVAINGWMNPRTEIENAERMGIQVFWIEDIWEHGVEAILRKSIEIAAEGTDGFYLSLDIDAMDAAFATGACCPTPGGLSTREMIELTRGYAGTGKLLGADIVETAPPLDPTPGGCQTALISGRLGLDVLSFHGGASYQAQAL